MNTFRPSRDFAGIPSGVGNRTAVRKRRLILHCGGTKTGSSALQSFFGSHRLELIECGILYPITGLSESREPKHQWIVTALLRDDRDEFERRLALVDAECDERIRTVILSTEGIFGHWCDFRPEPRRWFAELQETYDVALWLWLREPVAFYRSFYLQCLRNPAVDIVPAYASDLSAAEVLEDPWIAWHLDYAMICREMRALFGDKSLFIFGYGTRIVEKTCGLLDIPADRGEERLRNVTVMSQAGVEILRVLNRYPLDYVEKERAYALAVDLNALIGRRSEAFELTPSEVARVRNLATIDASEIERLDTESCRRWKARLP